MFQFDVTKHVPAFILADKNGYAIAKAIEAALQIMNDTIRQGVEILTDAGKMPEWRLDEVAWEYSLPFDYLTDIEVKRRWVENAYEQSRLYGTKAGIETYLKAIFPDAKVTEWPDYSGDPYHFKIRTDGVFSMENFARVVGTVNEIKSARSTFEELTFRQPTIESDLQLYAGAALYGIVNLEFTEADVPDLEAAFLVDELENMMTDEYGIYMTE